MSNRTEEPTPRRLRRAREDGDVASSGFASRAVAFCVALALLPAAVAAIGTRAAELVRAAVAHAADLEPRVVVDAASVGREVLALSAPLLFAVAVVAGVAGAIQTGGLFSPKVIAFDASRLDPLRGAVRLLSGAGLFAAVRALAGGAIAAWLVILALRAHAPDVARSAGRLEHAWPLAASVVMVLAWRAALLGLALGVVDLVFARGRWLARLRMTRTEIVRERKEEHGSPEAREARDRARRAAKLAAMVADAEEATVVVVDAPFACALRYEPGGAAPKVVARGDGDLGDRIVRAAEARGVPVRRDAALARALRSTGVGEGIGAELYADVAALLREVLEAR
jgi:flagellar biosynthesis protein FlhB